MIFAGARACPSLVGVTISLRARCPRSSVGGPDHPRWVAGICPNRHREVHYGERGDEINERLAAKLQEEEVEEG